jgi:hypothetical protein
MLAPRLLWQSMQRSIVNWISAFDGGLVLFPMLP